VYTPAFPSHTLDPRFLPRSVRLDPLQTFRLRVQGLGFRFWVAGFKVCALGFMVYGLGFMVQGLGFEVWV
jgi:hypothetical protein